MSIYERTIRSHNQRIMDNPITDGESIVAHMLEALRLMGDEYANDYVIVPAIEHLGHALVVFLNADIGRLDPGVIDREARAIVTEAGGDGDEI